MQSQFLAAINQLCEEKGLDKDVIFETVKAAYKTAYRKDYGHRDQEIDVEFNENTETPTIFLCKNVVETVENEELEMTLAAAKKYNKTAKIEDIIRIDVTPLEYGRIAAQAAKQVIIQKIQEAEREKLYQTFKDRENELLSAIVHRVDGGNVYVDLERITTILTPHQQIPHEKYYGGQRIKLYLDKVIKTPKGPQLLISRSHKNLVVKLMELEIPEIENGAVEIKGVARDAGVRTKIVVHSSDEKIDPIGSCVGQKGVRIQNIMKELSNERIDIIEWNEDKIEYLKSTLSPAEINNIVINEETKHAQVFVAVDQRPLAIGRNGQNVRLASALTGYEIDILDAVEGVTPSAPKTSVSTTKEPVKKEEVSTEIVSFEEISEDTATKLAEANLTNLSQLVGLSAKDLMDVDGVSEEEANILVGLVKAHAK